MDHDIPRVLLPIFDTGIWAGIGRSRIGQEHEKSERFNRWKFCKDILEGKVGIWVHRNLQAHTEHGNGVYFVEKIPGSPTSSTDERMTNRS
jgi:hypothetical protein